jgi:hypothetical protein
MTDAGRKQLKEMHVASLSIKRLDSLLDREECELLDRHIERAREFLAGRIV